MSKMGLHFEGSRLRPYIRLLMCRLVDMSHHGNVRACSSSAFWLRNAAVGYIRICKRRSDRFAMLATSCAIAEEVKRTNNASMLRYLESFLARQDSPCDSRCLVCKGNGCNARVTTLH